MGLHGLRPLIEVYSCLNMFAHLVSLYLALADNERSRAVLETKKVLLPRLQRHDEYDYQLDDFTASSAEEHVSRHTEK